MTFQAHGKQVKRGDEHYADAASTEAAAQIAYALNLLPGFYKCWPSCGCGDKCSEMARRMKIVADKINGGNNGIS